MTKAIWNEKVIAESDNVQVIEGNYYFPANNVQMEYLEESDTHTTCPWKGEASYYHLEVDGERIVDAAWYYPEPKHLAAHIKNYIAFWRGVLIKD